MELLREKTQKRKKSKIHPCSFSHSSRKMQGVNRIKALGQTERQKTKTS